MTPDQGSPARPSSPAPTSTPARWAAGRVPALVLLDLDGTLADSAPGITASMKHAFVEHGLPVPADEVLATFVGPPFAVALAGLGHDAEQAQALVTTYRADYARGRLFDATLYPGIPEALSALAAAGVTLAVATSKPQATARRIVEHFGLASVLCGGLEGVFGADPTRAGDAKADVIGRALAALGREAGPDVLMVGDRVHDVEGAAQHSLATVGVAWGYAADGELLDAGAVTLVDTPADLVRLLLGREATPRPA